VAQLINIGSLVEVLVDTSANSYWMRGERFVVTRVDGQYIYGQKQGCSMENCILAKDARVIKEKEDKMSEDKNERGLFQIRAVDIETDEVVYQAEIVAEGEKEALFDSDLKEVLKNKNLTRHDVDILVKELDSLPARTRIKRSFWTGKKRGKRKKK